MIFFIEVNKDKDCAIKLEKELASFLIENKQEITQEIKKSDIILSLGGDGTFIRAVNKYRKHNKGIIGINCGTLGYLTELNPNNYKEKLLKLINQEYTVNKRIGIVGEVNGIKKEACNDVVIRNNSMNIIDFDVYIDNNFLASLENGYTLITLLTMVFHQQATGL